MTDALRVQQKSTELRGAGTSVLYAYPEEERNYLVTLMDQGLTLDEALGVMADKIALDGQRVTYKGPAKVENPYDPPH